VCTILGLSYFLLSCPSPIVNFCADQTFHRDNECWVTVASVSDVMVSSTEWTSPFHCIIPIVFK
jgi:hypothetical protein